MAVSRRVPGHLPRRAFLARGAKLAAGAVVLSLFGPASELAPRAAHAEALREALETSLLELTNADRETNGLSLVELDVTLLEIARERAASQLGQSPLSHYDATDEPPLRKLLAAAGVQYRLAGENLARWRAADPDGPQRVEQAWMRSPIHLKNILEPSFNRLAVGAATDALGRVAFAQVFRATP
jgi:uncharacterized protein YkwD